jgi:hypothetical protein
MGNFASFAKIFLGSYFGKGIVLQKRLCRKSESDGKVVKPSC